MTEAAGIAHMHISNLQYYVKHGRGPAYEEVAGRKVFDRLDVVNWKPIANKRGRKPNKDKASV